MKGEIFNLLDAFVKDQFGEDAFESILDGVAADLSTKEPFVGPGTYPDSDFFLIVRAVTVDFDVPMEQALCTFGEFCLPRLLEKMPLLVSGHDHPKQFLEDLDGVIHVEVRKLYERAEPPKFTYCDTGDNTASLVYESGRKMYGFAEGLLRSLAKYYDVPISIQRRVLDEELGICEFLLRFD